MTAPDLSASRPSASGRRLRLLLRKRPRLFIAAALMIAGYFLSPSDFRFATRALIAWNIGGWGFIAMILTMVARAPRGAVRRHAADEDENPWVLLLIAIAAAAAAMVAIVAELGPVKNMSGYVKGAHVALVVATILSAWTFIHLMFALHYAGQFYAQPRSGVGVRGGLDFPGAKDPDWGEFLYQAFVIGCACATADVDTTSSAMRRDCLVQGVVAFLFNTIILALTINIGAGFI